MQRLTGRVALVTGAARGIGLAVARRLVDEGAQVVLTDIRDDDGAAAASALGAGLQSVNQVLNRLASDDVFIEFYRANNDALTKYFSSRFPDVTSARIKAWLAIHSTALTPDHIDFILDSGFRPPSEIIGLRWDKLNRTDRTITILDRKDPKRKIGNNQTVPLINGSFDIVMRQPRTSGSR